MTLTFRVLSLTCLAALCACSAETPPAGPPAGTAAPSLQAIVLKADPGAAEHVKAAKAAGARDKVTVTGRIADVVGGLAVFRLMDVAIPYCGEKNPEDHCKTPWDYCCESKETILASSLLVEVRGDDGKPIATPALPDLRLLDLVKVRGKMVTDDHGNQALLADGLFRVQRPQVPDDLRWPQ